MYQSQAEAEHQEEEAESDAGADSSPFAIVPSATPTSALEKVAALPATAPEDGGDNEMWDSFPADSVDTLLLGNKAAVAAGKAATAALTAKAQVRSLLWAVGVSNLPVWC